MLPNPHDLPAKPAERAVHAAVAGLVRREFLFPECTIAGRDFAMLGTAMPKTSVHKNGQSDPGENEVRLAEDFLIPTPAGDLVPAE